MWKTPPWMVTSAASWLRQTRLWDMLYRWCWCDGGFEAARRVTLEFVTRRSHKTKSYVPELLLLEDRVVPSTLPSLAVTIVNPGPETNHVGDLVKLQLNATSIGSDPLIFFEKGLPAGLVINRSTGLISGTPLPGSDANSPFQVSITATDPYPRTGNYLQATANFTWTITPPANTDNQGNDTKPTVESLAKPMAFELNVGQSDSQVKFLSRGLGYNLFLTNNQAVLTLARPDSTTSSADSSVSIDPRKMASAITQDVIDISFLGANADTRVVASGELAQRSNYFLGSQSFTDVPNYSRVRVENLYPGISIEYYGTQQGELEYDVIVAPGADLAQVRLQYQGIKHAHTDAKGNLVLQTAGGELTQQAPVFYQRAVHGTRQSVTGRFKLNAEGTVGFEAGDYDPAQPLIIDPILQYGTYLGGSSSDAGYAIATDLSGNAYVTGTTSSTDFPTLNPFQPTLASAPDAFVSKFSPSGALLYSTYLGGSYAYGGFEQGNGIAVDAAGEAIVVGTTNSSDFPTTAGAYETSLPDPISSFVTKLNASGDALLFSTYFGYATANAVAVDAQGEPFVTGFASGSNFPTTSGAFQTTLPGSGTPAFVTKFSADGSALTYSTFLGGTGGTGEVGRGIAVDSTGAAFVTGDAGSTSFPTTSGAFQTSPGGGTQDAFVAKLNAAGSSLVYSSYLGGSGWDWGRGIAIDSSGNAYVVGDTLSMMGSSFPTTTGTYQTSVSGMSDAFVTKVSADGTTMVYSTLLGGSGGETGGGIAVTSDGQATIVGSTSSSDFPTASALAGTSYIGGGSNVFVTRLNSAGTSLTFSSYLGVGFGYGAAVDVNENAYATGEATGTIATTSGAFQTSLNGTSDAFVEKIIPGILPPVITSITTDTGYSGSDLITNDQTLVITGTAPNSSTVTLFLAGVSLGTATADGSGNWSYDYTGTTLAEGVHSFTAQATLSGLTSALSNAFLVTVDLTAPDVTLTVPSTTSFFPFVTVQATDLVGIPNSATVSLDVDLDGDNDFTDTGETGYATGALVNGSATIGLALTSSGTYKVRARVTDLAGNEGASSVQTLTIITVSSPWSLSDTRVVSSELADGQTLQMMGGLRLAHALDLDQSPGSVQSGSPALVYNSDLTDVRPIVETTLQFDNAGSLPSTVTAQLTWDGTTQSAVNFSTSAIALGDKVTLAVQVDSPVATTGRYAWSLVISASSYSNLTVSGTAFIRSEDSSPFGAGWTFGTLNRLVSISASGSDPAGQLWLYGTGDTRFFEGTSGTLTSPAEDNGTLVKNTGGTFTYTTPENVKIDFDSSGYQTDWLSGDGFQTISFTYTSNLLTGMTAIDGATTALSYSSGLLDTIIVASTRTWDSDYTGTDLTQITNPDTNTRSFTISGSYPHHVTVDTQGSLVNSWHYNSHELVDQSTWGNSSSPTVTTIVPVAFEGLDNLVVGSPVSTITDAVGSVTVSTLDAKGRLIKQINPIGGISIWSRDSAGRVTGFTDPMGRVTGYTRDGAGYVTTLTNPDSTTQVSTFSTDGYHSLLDFTDENGNETDYTYSLGRVLTITNALEQVTTNTYNSTTGLLATITDPVSRVVYLYYDTHRRLESRQDVLGETDYTYDSTTGEVESITDALTHETDFGYDAMGRMTSRTTPDTYGESWTFNSSGQFATHTDKMGVVDQPGYDPFGRGLIVSQSEAVGTALARTTLSIYDDAGRFVGSRDPMGFGNTLMLDPLGRTFASIDPMLRFTFSRYDAASELLASIDSMGFMTQYVYSNRGWVTQSTDPRGKTSYNYYDYVGNVTSATDALSNTSYTTFDVLNRVIGTQDPAGNTTATSYWDDGRVEDQTDGRGKVTHTEYDLENKKIYVTSAYGLSSARTVTQTLDAVGNVIKSKDALNHEWTFTLDNMDRASGTSDPLSHTTGTTFNKNSAVTKATDGLTKDTNFTVDLFSRTIEVKDPTNKSTKSIFNADDELVGTLDGKNNLTAHGFDGDGEENVTIDAKTGKSQKIYDDDGRLIAFIDSLGNVTKWGYDPDGNKISETDSLANTRTWTYDDDNRVDVYTDKRGWTKDFDYFDNGLVETETDKDDTSTTVNTKYYTYNEDDQPLTATDDSGEYEWTYDDLGRVDTVTDPNGFVLDFDYDDADRLESVTDSLGGETDFTYDNADRMETQSFTDGTTSLSQKFTYNNRNDLTQVDRYSDTTQTTKIGLTTYGYDDAQLLTSITHKNAAGTTTLDSFNYTFDDADNIEQETSTLGPTKNYTVDKSNQITGDGTNTYDWDANGNNKNFTVGTNNQVDSDGTWNFAYDEEGNETQKTNISTGQVWLYGYDADNRLVKAEHKASSTSAVDLRVEFGYDVLNNRIAKTVDSDGDGSGAAVTTKFAYDSSGNAYVDFTGSSTIVARHVFGAGPDALIARIASGSAAWYLQDNLGSTRDLTNSAGSLIDHLDYNSFGKLTYESASGSDRYLWTAREYDAEIDLQYNRARYYDANTGRWISQDPLGFDAGDSNLYRYVNNRPTRATDPSGLQGRTITMPADQHVAPGHLPVPGNPTPQKTIDMPLIIASKLVSATLGTPSFDTLTATSEALDLAVPLALQAVRKSAGFFGIADAAWVKLDAELPVLRIANPGGWLTAAAAAEIGQNANNISHAVKAQLLPRYYLAEKKTGFVKANAKNLKWERADAWSGGIEAAANAALGGILEINQSVPLGNERTISFRIPIKIRVEIYFATLKK